MTKGQIKKVCETQFTAHIDQYRDRAKAMIAEHEDITPELAADITVRCAASFAGDLLSDVLVHCLPEHPAPLSRIQEDVYSLSHRTHKKRMGMQIQEYLQKSNGSVDLLKLAEIIFTAACDFTDEYTEDVMHEALCGICYPQNLGELSRINMQSERPRKRK